MERKLTAILYADVAGYSRLTDADEEGTHRVFRAHFDALTGGIEAHGGRVVHTAGDAVLAEFASVVTAVNCAVTAQRDLGQRNESLPAEQRLEFRIGVNLGDVIVDGEEIYGNGVNVAARLETLAAAGGICISERVREQVAGNVAVGFESLGPQQVKNIEAPVDAYSVLLDPGDAGKRIDRVRRRRVRWLAPAAAALALVAGAAGWWWWWNATPRLEPASMDAMAFPLPPKPSVAVLPFEDLGGTPGPGQLADGMTENLIATLTRLPGLFVIAKNSVFTYKDKTVPVQRIAEQLGVRYVLEGSVQRAGERLRITVQLVDATKGRYVWSERYDRGMDNLFALQDEIALATATGLRVKLTGATSLLRTGSTRDVDAWLDNVNGRKIFEKFTKEANARARALHQRAVARDPRFAQARVGIGWTYWIAARFRYAVDWEASLRKAGEMADKAAAIAPDLPDVHLLRSQIHFVRGEFDRAVAEARNALALDPGNARILAVMGQTLLYAGGEYDESIRATEEAMRLNPYFPSWYLLNVGRAKMFKRDYAGAVEAAEQGLARAESPFMSASHLVTEAMAYAESGDLAKARQAMDRVRKDFPKLTVATYAERYRFKRQADWDRFASALRVAGLPEGKEKIDPPAK